MLVVVVLSCASSLSSSATQIANCVRGWSLSGLASQKENVQDVFNTIVEVTALALDVLITHMQRTVGAALHKFDACPQKPNLAIELDERDEVGGGGGDDTPQAQADEGEDEDEDDDKCSQDDGDIKLNGISGAENDDVDSDSDDDKCSQVGGGASAEDAVIVVKEEHLTQQPETNGMESEAIQSSVHNAWEVATTVGALVFLLRAITAFHNETVELKQAVTQLCQSVRKIRRTVTQRLGLDWDHALDADLDCAFAHFSRTHYTVCRMREYVDKVAQLWDKPDVTSDIATNTQVLRNDPGYVRDLARFCGLHNGFARAVSVASDDPALPSANDDGVGWGVGFAWLSALSLLLMLHARAQTIQSSV